LVLDVFCDYGERLVLVISCDFNFLHLLVTFLHLLVTLE
jgi:hypothetical protein